MKPSTLNLHRALIRFAKGMLSAWESWLNEESKEQK
jgi:hypothetical protein